MNPWAPVFVLLILHAYLLQGMGTVCRIFRSRITQRTRPIMLTCQMSSVKVS